MILESQLANAAVESAALDVALESIPSAAFLVDRTGAVRLANSAGRRLLDEDGVAVADRLRAAIAGQGTSFAVHRVAADGLPLHYVAVQRRRSAGLEDRVASAALRWSLTRRQTQVLALLAGGRANKTIADALECSTGTVELHVTSILQKAGAESRAHLVAIFWSELPW